MHAKTLTKSLVGAGVAVSVPVSGALVSAPAEAAPAKPAAKPTSTTTPRLAYGSSGPAVKLVQSRLGVAADGVFGALTLNAVKRFQSANGLAADGIVGTATWAKLGTPSASTGSKTTPGTTAPSKSAMSCTSAGTVLRYGMTHQLVKVLQSHLGVSPTGFFGAQTQRAVMGFQSSHGLVSDGIVGAATWNKLGCATSAAKPPTTTTPATTVPTNVVSGPALVAMAKRYIGVPYVWGGATPSGFDCSGLTTYVLKQFGISMPRTAAQQQAYFTPIGAPRVGDLIFYGKPAYHVAIYIGNGMMIDAPHPGGAVGVHTMYGTPSSYARAI